MTADERIELAQMHREFRAHRDMLIERLDTLDSKVDAVESRLDRWDGAVTFIKAAASFLGVGGLGLMLAALVEAVTTR